MRKLILLAGVVAGLGTAFAFGFTAAANAQTTDGQTAATVDGAALLDDGPRHPGRPGPGRPGPRHPGGPGRGEPGTPPAAPSDECLALMKAVHTACPCNGVDGAGWGSHGDYVQCVTTALNGATDECATKILERATNSKVGEPGFECKRPHGRGPGKPGRRPMPEPTAEPLN